MKFKALLAGISLAVSAMAATPWFDAGISSYESWPDDGSGYNGKVNVFGSERLVDGKWTEPDSASRFYRATLTR